MTLETGPTVLRYLPTVRPEIRSNRYRFAILNDQRPMTNDRIPHVSPPAAAKFASPQSSVSVKNRDPKILVSGQFHILCDTTSIISIRIPIKWVEETQSFVFPSHIGKQDTPERELCTAQSGTQPHGDRAHCGVRGERFCVCDRWRLPLPRDGKRMLLPQGQSEAADETQNSNEDMLLLEGCIALR